MQVIKCMTTLDLIKILDQPSLVILIDCWDNVVNDNELQVMNNIRKFCLNNLMVNTIALSTFSDPWNPESMEEPWYSNGKELFCDTTKWDLLRRSWQQVSFSDRSLTHPLIKDMPVRNDQLQILMWNTMQLLYYCNHINPSIENIFVLGFAWNNCLKTRSTGWKEIYMLNEYNLFSSKKNILSNLNCVMIHDQYDVSSPWINLTDEIIMLDTCQVTDEVLNDNNVTIPDWYRNLKGDPTA